MRVAASGVLGLDFSHAILGPVCEVVATAGLADRIELMQGDQTAIILPTGSMERVVCRGVHMQVPAINEAVAELSRLLASGGTFVVSEGNRRPIQAVALRWLKKLLRRERAQLIPTPADLEYW